MKKITIIGSGLVGATSAYALMLKEVADEIVLVNNNKSKLKAELTDIRHGYPFLSKTVVRAGDYADCKDSDIIVITSGASRKVGETREMLLANNKAIMEDICSKIKETKTNAIVVVVSNPVDILANVVAKELNLPKGKVMGTGCSLDTSRLIAVLAEKFNVPTHRIKASIVGEHSDAQVVEWDKVEIDGKKLELSAEEKEEIASTVRKAGMTIIEGKGKTYYGIATSVCAIASAILSNKPQMLSVSVPDQTKDMAYSQVVEINVNGFSIKE